LEGIDMYKSLFGNTHFQRTLEAVNQPRYIVYILLKKFIL